jgi:hypothetical protein
MLLHCCHMPVGRITDISEDPLSHPQRSRVRVSYQFIIDNHHDELPQYYHYHDTRRLRTVPAIKDLDIFVNTSAHATVSQIVFVPHSFAPCDSQFSCILVVQKTLNVTDDKSIYFVSCFSMYQNKSGILTTLWYGTCRECY